MVFRTRATLLFVVCMLVACVAGACGSDDSNFGADGGSTFNDDSGSSTTPDSSSIGLGGGDGSTKGPLVISPANDVINVTAGGAIPPVKYTATMGGTAVTPAWSIDRGELGSIDVSSGVLTPTGTLGGVATISATYGATTATTQVTIILHLVQNGATNDDTAEADAGVGGGFGTGGFGGVGGSGVGGAYANPGIFPGAPTADASLQLLYPYNNTVWPRGLLAPLLQWSGDKVWDGLYIHIQEAAFEYTGTFSKPSGAATFINHPIPIDAWNQMEESNAGEMVNVTVELAVAGVPYGPITTTWKIASAPLTGTVYYQSYGTNLATNFGGAKPDNHRFGAATLGIKAGATAPVLVAGTTTPDSSGCRVCHSVSSDGSQLITKWSDDVTTSTYDLHGTPGSNETEVLPAGTNLAWPAVSNDGAYVFTDSSGAIGSNTTPSAARWIPTGDNMTSSGIPTGLRAAFPVFSPDGKHVAFTWYGGAVTGFGTGDTNTLAIMDFTGPTGAEDAGGGGVAFANFMPLYNPASSDAGVVGLRAIYPSFLPTNDSLVFENELQTDGRNGYGETRADCDTAGAACVQIGAEGELWWVDTKTHTAHRLDNLNGDSYLPSFGALHNGGADAMLNYEPTVNPVPSGGYAWVVFTSRRLYGNVATRNAYESDPRNFDTSATSPSGPTPKKLWVAAIDLSAPPGTDPSHPAFYLPAQEIFAGNSRGYWVVNPCESDGSSCSTGDECCGGFCRPGSDGGLVCTDTKPTCAQVSEKCATASDCCGAAAGILCIDSVCATPTPR